MSKNLLIPLVVGLVIVVGAGVIITRRTAAPALITTQDVPSSIDPSTSPSTGQSLRSLFASATPQQCTFQDNATVSQGIIYIAAGTARGDFTTTINNTPTVTHMISKGTDIYLWVDEQTTGFKTTLAQNPAQGVDLDKPLDYSCSPWPLDTTVFTLPSTVTFTTLPGLTPNP